MTDIDIPNYSIYHKKLVRFIHSLGVKLIEKDDAEDDGMYIPLRKTIRIAGELGPAEEIAVLLHEVGHVLDEIVGFKLHTASLEKAYAAIYTGKFTEHQRKLVLRTEKRAWVNARELARYLKIPLGKWFSDTQKQCLNDYRYH